MHMWAWYIHTHTKAYLHTGTHTQASTRLWIQTLAQTGGEHSFCLASECFEPSRHWPWTYRSQFVCKTDSPTHGHPDTRTLAHTRVWGVIKTTSIQCFFFFCIAQRSLFLFLQFVGSAIHIYKHTRALALDSCVGVRICLTPHNIALTHTHTLRFVLEIVSCRWRTVAVPFAPPCYSTSLQWPHAPSPLHRAAQHWRFFRYFVLK